MTSAVLWAMGLLMGFLAVCAWLIRAMEDNSPAHHRPDNHGGFVTTGSGDGGACGSADGGACAAGD